MLVREYSMDITAAAIEVAGYRSMGLEKGVLEREHSGDVAAGL